MPDGGHDPSGRRRLPVQARASRARHGDRVARGSSVTVAQGVSRLYLSAALPPVLASARVSVLVSATVLLAPFVQRARSRGVQSRLPVPNPWRSARSRAAEQTFAISVEFVIRCGLAGVHVVGATLDDPGLRITGASDRLQSPSIQPCPIRTRDTASEPVVRSPGTPGAAQAARRARSGVRPARRAPPPGRGTRASPRVRARPCRPEIPIVRYGAPSSGKSAARVSVSVLATMPGAIAPALAPTWRSESYSRPRHGKEADPEPVTPARRPGRSLRPLRARTPGGTARPRTHPWPTGRRSLGIRRVFCIPSGARRLPCLSPRAADASRTGRCPPRPRRSDSRRSPPSGSRTASRNAPASDDAARCPPHP